MRRTRPSAPGPGNYNTLSTDNGPSHTIVVGLKLGANVDGDGGALQNATANADDVNGALPDDEDGLTNPAADLVLTIGAQPTVNVRRHQHDRLGRHALRLDRLQRQRRVRQRHGTRLGRCAQRHEQPHQDARIPGGANRLHRHDLRPLPPEHRRCGWQSDGLGGRRRSRRLPRSDHCGRAGGPTRARPVKIASGTNGGPMLANGDMHSEARLRRWATSTATA